MTTPMTPRDELVGQLYQVSTIAVKYGQLMEKTGDDENKYGEQMMDEEEKMIRMIDSVLNAVRGDHS